MGDRPQRDAHVLDQLLADGSMVLFHQVSQQLLSLNPTGALIWEYCDGTHTPAGIAAEVQPLFPEASTLSSDVTDLLGRLQGLGMLRADG